MNSSSQLFVYKSFAGYYEECSSKVPSSIELREFGFLTFKDRKMLRHIGLKTSGDLKAFLQKATPLDAYYSCAYYEDPEAEMNKKGWLGADLVFDIDADHIPTTCGKVHDEWVCGNCGFAGKGTTPEHCPVCNGQKFDVKSWPCEVCLESAKAEIVKLLDMLMNDLGFSEKEISSFFSGHRGYHVHVESEVIKTLDSVARKELVDYVSGLGLDIAFHGYAEKSWSPLRTFRSSNLNNSGWRGRIVKGLHDFVLNAEQEDYENIGLKKNVVNTLMKNKDALLKTWDNTGTWSAVKGVGFETWKKIAESCVKSQSAKIDTVVTTDIHRLIRLAGSLHGKTGLKKVGFEISDIEVFDPFKSAVAFKKGSTSVFVFDVPEFRLGEETYGPYKNQKVELPTAAAILLICKDRAEVVEQNVQ